MTGMEQRLRDALHAAASEVTADPALYERVQRRLRRRRVLTWVGAAGAVTAAVAVVVLLVPSLTRTRVELVPAPVATQPAPDVTEPAAPAAAGPCAGDTLVAVFATADGDLDAVCATTGVEPLRRTPDVDEADPTLSPDGRLAYEAGDAVEVVDLASGERLDRIDGASSPTFSQGGVLAYVRNNSGEVHPLVVVEMQGADASFTVIVGDPHTYGSTVRQLRWEAGETARILYAEVTDGEGRTNIWADDFVEPEGWEVLPGAQGGEGVYRAPALRRDGILHALRGGGGDVEIVAATLPHGSSVEVVTTLSVPGRFQGDASLTPAGRADFDGQRWTAGDADAWLVGDGDQLWLADAAGDVDLVAAGIAGVAFGTAVELPASPSPEQLVGPPADGLLLSDGTDTVFMALDDEAATEVLPSQADGVDDVAVHPASTFESVTAVAVVDGRRVEWGRWSETAQEGEGGLVSESPDLVTSVAFSPDGGHLAWVSVTDPGDWMLNTVDWTAAGPGDGDASFGLDFGGAGAGQVRVQDWVWTAEDGSTAEGYVLLAARTYPPEGQRLFRVPIERQADGALGVTGDPEPIVDGEGWSSSAAGGGYTLQVQIDGETVSAARVLRDGQPDATVDVSAHLAGVDRLDVRSVWLNGLGSTVVYGDGRGNGWHTEFDGTRFSEPVQLAPTMVSAALFGGGALYRGD